MSLKDAERDSVYKKIEEDEPYGKPARYESGLVQKQESQPLNRPPNFLTSGDQNMDIQVEQALLDFNELKSEALLRSDRHNSRDN